MTTSWFTGADGTKLFVRKWIPETGPQAALQIVHGMGEHSLRYERFAHYLCEAGIEIWAADMRGHGFTADLKVNAPSSGGKFGHCADRSAPEKLLADIHLINTIMHETRPDLPLFLMGHSWGSFLAQAYIENFCEPPLAGCILSGTRGQDAGPLIKLGRLFLSFLLLFRRPGSTSRLASLLAAGAYKKPMTPSKTSQDWLSCDEAEVEAFINDPLCGKTPSLGFFRDLAVILYTIHQKENLERIPRNLPVYVFSGSQDTAGNMGESPKALVKQYTALGMTDVEFVLYPGARHEMLHETNYQEVQVNLLSWIIKHKKKGSTPCVTGTRGNSTVR